MTTTDDSSQHEHQFDFLILFGAIYSRI